MNPQEDAAKAEPLTSFPLEGFYGGKIARIAIDYDDNSSKVIGDPESIANLRAALQALPRYGEESWRPIESAPKDGTYILAWRALLDVPLVVTWERPAQTPPMMRLVSTERHDHEGFWRQPMSAKPTPYQPTHWQPLPLPPQAKGG